MRIRITSLRDLAFLIIVALLVGLIVLLFLWIHEIKLLEHEYELFFCLRNDLEEMSLTQLGRKAGNKEAKMFNSSTIEKLKKSDITIDHYEEAGEGIIQLIFHGKVDVVTKALILLKPFRLTRIELERGGAIDEGIQVRVSVQNLDH